MNNNINTEQFNEFVKNIRMINVVLDKLEAYVDREELLGSKKEGLPVSIDEAIVSNKVIDNSQGLFEVSHKVVFRTKLQRKVVVKIESVFTAIYKVEPPDVLKEEYVKLFGETDSRLHLWPYQREIVQSITTKMGLPPFILPPMVFLPSKL